MRAAFPLTLVDIREVCAKAIDRLQHGRPVDEIHELSVSIHIRPEHSREALARASIHLPLDHAQLFLVFHTLLPIPRVFSEVRGHTPVRAIQRLHRLRIQVLDRLLVAAADAVRSAAVAVEGVDGLGDAHLRGRHGAQRVEVAFGFFLQAERGGFQGAVAALFDFVLPVVGLFHLTGLHHDLGSRAADLTLHVRLLRERLGTSF